MVARSTMSPIRVLICGAAPRRSGDPGWTDPGMIRAAVGTFLLPGDVVIEGEAQGADQMGREAAEAYGLRVLAYPAKWSRWGSAAGPIRNKQMLDEGQPTEVWAFHDDLSKSTGTRDMVRRAKKAGLPVWHFSHARPEGVAL